jgi:hypothetical protein
MYFGVLILLIILFYFCFVFCFGLLILFRFIIMWVFWMLIQTSIKIKGYKTLSFHYQFYASQVHHHARTQLCYPVSSNSGNA